MRTEVLKVRSKDTMKYHSSWTKGERWPDGEYVHEVNVTYDDFGKIIPEMTYTEKYCRENKLGKYSENNDAPSANSNKPKESNPEKKEGDGCLVKILKSPFKLLWWVIKKILGILTLGLLSSWLNGK